MPQDPPEKHTDMLFMKPKEEPEYSLILNNASFQKTHHGVSEVLGDAV